MIDERYISRLKKIGFDPHPCSSAEEVREAVSQLIAPGESVGFGGSMTTRGLGLVEHVRAGGHLVFDHWDERFTKEETLKIRYFQKDADVFISSVNAAAETGELVIADGFGNRIAGTTFGPRKVILVFGTNKITPDLTTALTRSREIASVGRARSLRVATPCVSTGTCSDCDSPARICRVTMIIERPPLNTRVHTIVFDGELGL